MTSMAMIWFAVTSGRTIFHCHRVDETMMSRETSCVINPVVYFVTRRGAGELKYHIINRYIIYKYTIYSSI